MDVLDKWQACERTLTRYMYAYDRKDIEGCLALLTEDVRFELDSGTGKGQIAYREHLERPRPEGLSTHHHLSSFVLIGEADDLVTSDYLLFIPYLLRGEDGDARSGFLSRRYQDKHRNANGEWLICERRFIEEIVK